MQGTIPVSEFDLAATLMSGQAFRWALQPDGWFEGVVGHQVWRLRQTKTGIDWDASAQSSIFNSQSSITHYLALDRSLPAIRATLPDDPHLRAALAAHAGLRVLRQEHWETLASFIASSTKQIVQIRQIVAELSRRFGEPVGDDGQCAFPAPGVVARCALRELRDCKLGFRAEYLRAAARRIDAGEVDLAALSRLELERARETLEQLPGVGEKIALCTLLFSCGFDQAFPIDVWIERALRRLYFPERDVTRRQLREFTGAYFGPYAGWAQQYLFCNERRRGHGGRRRECRE